MFYEERVDTLGLRWFKTSPNGKWELLIPENVQIDINKRWEEGVPHHERSIDLVKALQFVDNKFCNTTMDLETGGDGDNGETLLYVLDIIFDSAKWRH